MGFVIGKKTSVPAARSGTPATKQDLVEMEKRIVMTQKELADQLTALTGQVQKIGTETAALEQKVNDLESALNAGGDVSPEVQTALDALKAQVQVVDDLVPDPTPAPTPDPAAQ